MSVTQRWGRRGAHALLALVLAVAAYVLAVTAHTDAAHASPVPGASFSQPLVAGVGADPQIYQYQGRYILFYSDGFQQPEVGNGNQVWVKVSTSLAGLETAPLVSLYSLESGHGTTFSGQ
jgi:hypothetical protein